MSAASLGEQAASERGISFDALVDLVRCAMASGAVAFIDKARDGEIDPAAPMTDAFGDFPANFLNIRPSLVEALAEATS